MQVISLPLRLRNRRRNPANRCYPMSNPLMKFKFFYVATTTLLLVCVLSGCKPGPIQPPIVTAVCPGKTDMAEAIEVVKANSKNIITLKADGECMMQYHSDDGKEHKERFPVKIRIVPPNRIYVQGGPLFMPNAILVGANEEEFWAWLKPDKMSTYWWGRLRQMRSCVDVLALNPYNMLQALGVVVIDDMEGWSLWNKSVFDVLEKRNPSGTTSQRIFIHCCDYLVRRIEYYNASGRAVLIIMLDQYRQISRGFSAPKSIKIYRISEDGKNDFIDVKLNSIQPAKFSGKQLDFMFSRPKPKGFKHVFRVGPKCRLIGK
jgi:hypothetical protein